MSGDTCIVCGGACTLLFPKHGFEIVRCQQCGLGMATPRPSPEELAAFYANAYYDGAAELGYHTEYGELEAGLKKTYTRFLERVERRHPGRRFERVLDVGCAFGFFLDAVEERWHPTELVGVDISPEAGERNTRPGRTFHAGLFEDVALPAQHFDFVYMGDALEHVHDPLAVADKLARVLVPGGVLVLTTVDFGSWLARALGERWRLLTPPEHLQFWTRQSLARLFRDRGFDATVENYWLFYPKSYVYQRTKTQFGFTPRFLAMVPGDLIPIPSFDAMVGMFQRRA